MHQPPILIGLAGAQGSGKSTVAAYLRQSFGFLHLEFADPIRAQIADAFLLHGGATLLRAHTATLLRDPARKQQPSPALSLGNCADTDFLSWLAANTPASLDYHTPRSPRWLQQQWGDYLRATRGWDVLIKLMTENIQLARAANPAARIVVGGIRWNASAPNPEAEAATIRSLGGRVWHIHRPSHPHGNGHDTERALPIHPDDRALHNSADLPWLHFFSRNLLSVAIWEAERQPTPTEVAA